MGRFGKAWERFRRGEYDGALAMLSHYVTLPLIAIAIVVVLVSDDLLLRLAGVIALIFLEQIRDAWVVRELTGKKR